MTDDEKVVRLSKTMAKERLKLIQADIANREAKQGLTIKLNALLTVTLEELREDDPVTTLHDLWSELGFMLLDRGWLTTGWTYDDLRSDIEDLIDTDNTAKIARAKKDEQ